MGHLDISRRSTNRNYRAWRTRVRVLNGVVLVSGTAAVATQSVLLWVLTGILLFVLSFAQHQEGEAVQQSRRYRRIHREQKGIVDDVSDTESTCSLLEYRQTVAGARDSPRSPPPARSPSPPKPLATRSPSPPKPPARSPSPPRRRAPSESVSSAPSRPSEDALVDQLLANR
jgi:hypothetical protein